MRSYLLPAMLCLALTTHAQQTTPATDAPGNFYCPLQTLGTFYFTAPGANPTISTVKGLTIVSALDGNRQFGVSFTDVKEEHSITFLDGGTTIGPLKYKYVSTLDGIKGTYSPALSPAPPTGYDNSVSPPLCSTTAINATSPYVYYKDATGTPYGTPMITYEWQAPAGWTVNGTMSNGSNIIPGGVSVTLVPNATGSGTLQVRAQNFCNSTLKKSDWATFKVTRPLTVTTSVSPSTITCGYTSPVTFSIGNTTPYACITGFRWDIQKPAAWTLGGAAAPSSTTTTTPSLVLVPSTGTQDPGTVTVTPLVSGATLPGYTITPTWSTALPANSIVGNSDVCTSVTYSLSSALPTGATVTWGVTPSGKVTYGSNTGNTFTVTKNGTQTGVIGITATITNSCGGPAMGISKQNILVGIPNPTDIVGLNPPLPVSPGQLLELQADLSLVPTYNWTVEGGLIQGFSNLSQLVLLVDQCSSGLYNGWLNVHLSYQNSCGTSSTYTEYVMTDCSTGGGPANIVSVSPNPTASQVMVDTRKSKKNIREIRIVDKLGVVQKILHYGMKTDHVSLDLSGLKPDIYFIRIFDGKDWTVKQLRKQ